MACQLHLTIFGLRSLHRRQQLGLESVRVFDGLMAGMDRFGRVPFWVSEPPSTGMGSRHRQGPVPGCSTGSTVPIPSCLTGLTGVPRQCLATS
jgi:hypothetical protein